MAILFKNITKYSEEVYTEFLLFHNKKFGLKYNLYSVLIICTLLFFAIVQIKINNINFATIIVSIIAYFFLWRYLYPALNVSKTYNSKQIQSIQEFTFSFYKNYFTIQNNSQINSIKYIQLYKVFETDTFFYLYVNKTHSFLINKNSFLIGSANDFSNFISQKCLYKFRKEKESRFI